MNNNINNYMYNNNNNYMYKLQIVFFFIVGLQSMLRSYLFVYYRVHEAYAL
jgi:hypothetical protein